MTDETDIVVKLYVNERKSLYEIARILNTSYTRTRRLLLSAGVRPRSRKEAMERYVRYNTCIVCGAQFRPHERTTKCCSRKCFSEYMSRLQRENNSRWARKSEPYRKLDHCEWCGRKYCQLNICYRNGKPLTLCTKCGEILRQNI